MDIVNSTPTSDGKPLLDAESFQKLLAAAYVLQEHNDQLQTATSAHAENAEAPKQSEAAEILDTAHLSEATTSSNDTQTLSRIVATQQQIHTAQLNLQDATNLIADRTQQITRSSGAAIGLLEGQKLFYRAASGNATSLVGSKVDVDASLSAACLAAGESFECANCDTDVHVNAGLCRRYGIKALIAVPIFFEGKVKGSIEVHSASPDAFREHDVRTCQLMAGLVTEAMARAAELEWKQSLASERATMLRALDRLKPQLQQLAGESEFVAGKSVESTGGAGAAVAPAVDNAMPCIECGNLLESDQLFCGQCGTERPAKKNADLQSKWASMWDGSQTLSTEGAAGSMSESANEPQSSPLLGEDWDSIATGVGKTLDHSDTVQQSVAPLSSQPGFEAEPALAIPTSQVHDSAGMPKSYPWTSAAKAKNWLNSQRKKRTGSVIVDLWNSRRGDVCLAIAVLLVSVAMPWIIWSKPATTSSGSRNPIVASSGNPSTGSAVHRKKPPEPKLSLMEQLLVSMGLAEPPPVPAYTGNPSTQVWVDLHTALYYCPGTDLYGKTPKGKFTSQRDAQLDQFEPAYRRACD